MTDLSIRTLNSSTKTISPNSLAAFRGKLRGPVALPGEDGYDAARTIWNATIDRSPALVARCLGAADVINAVKLARDENLLVAVRGGGHNIAGNAVCDGGLLIDLSLMKSVRVDPASRTARVEPGATLADFDKEAQAFALATPLGINSTTGVAGLTLGGGFGWTTHKFGLTIDNLISADVATADARLVRASETEQPRPLLGAAGRRRQFRRRDLVRVQAPSAWPAGFVRSRRASARASGRAAARVPPHRQGGARRGRGLGGDAQGAAAALPAGRMARQGGSDLRRLLRRRHEGRREGPQTPARARQSDRRRDLSPPVHGLAGGVRSAADARRPQLLEEPRLPRTAGRGDQSDCATRPARCRRPNASCSSPMSAARWRAFRPTRPRGRTATPTSS